MPQATSPELYWLFAVAVITGLMWVPYILQLIVQMGPVAAFWDPYHETPHDAPWARRAKRAHANAVENLAVFAPLAIGIHVLGLGTEHTAAACAANFYVRLAHFAAYTLAVPLVRSLLFLAGFFCQVILAARLFGWVI